MMDIVERLRGDYSDERLELAADEIERLREALAKIAERDLQSIAKQAFFSTNVSDWHDALLEIQKYDNQAIAIDALSPNSRVVLEDGE